MEIAGIVELGDRRLSPAVRMVLCGVKARAQANAGEAEECWRNVALAEGAHTAAAEITVGGWQVTVASPVQLAAATGHALATLARRTGSAECLAEAIARLRTAVDGLDPATHTRAWVLCAARLSALEIATDRPGATALMERVVELAEGLRSERVTRAVDALQGTFGIAPATTEQHNGHKDRS